MHGDIVQLTTDTTSVTIAGNITSQGVLRDGCGYVELTLPYADPQQRRDLEKSKWFHYELYRSDALVYSSPHLVLRETGRTKDGFLVLSGSP
ncbi:hypothetical protein SMALB_6071 [Streptomyces malaysiensis]|uniref:Uncharacterized protein n=2 Tax=Streptomyces malaysiensis TaxID=92644 RepID=A0A7X5X7D4_STRMQ|nr:hypothetical protein [Streptomyces malaysiensis]